MIALLMLATVGVAAQDKPDFSGRWVLATPQQSDTDIPLVLSVRQTLVGTPVHGEPMEPFFRDITIERQFETGTHSENHRIGMQGGTVSGLRADGSPNGPTAHYAVRWDGDALIFESGNYSGQRPKPACGLNAVKSGRSMPMVASAWLSLRAAPVMVRGPSR